MLLLSLMLFFILSSCAVVRAQNESDWILRVVDFGTHSPEVDASLYYNNSVILKIYSTSQSTAVWKLSTIIPHPSADSWKLTARVRVTAPNVDLDYNMKWATGEAENNDGPNFFGFIYGYEGATVEKPGFVTNTFSFFSYPSDSHLCHVHFECNWLGNTQQAYGVFCSSGSARHVYQGRVSDGPAVDNYNTDEIKEAFTSGEWKTIEMNIGSTECLYDNLTILFMGADALPDKDYIWEITNITIKAGNTTYLPLDHVYDMSKGEYLELPPYCGNGIVDKENGEECDGDVGVPSGYKCTSDCKLETICGDGIIAGDEVCDSNNVTKGFKCSSDCMNMTPVCGDGLVVDGEICDPGVTNASQNYTPGFECSKDCQSLVPICGDGIVVDGEECDKENGTDNFTACSDDCKLYRILNENEELLLDTIFELSNETLPGEPASREIEFTSSGSLTVNDIGDQIDVKGVSWLPENSSFMFCSPNTLECEDDYKFTRKKVQLSNQTMAFKPSKGILRVYRADDEEGSTTFFIGFKPEGEAMPALGEFGTIAGVVIALVVIGILFLIIAMLLFFYYKKKKRHSKLTKSKKDLNKKKPKKSQ